VIFRYLLRSRFFTILNMLGLSIGLACCIIIFSFVKNELSYDRFHQQGDFIYRVIRQSEMSNMPYNIGITSGPYAGALQQDYGDRFQDITRAFVFNGLVQYEDKSFIEEKLLLADKNFFSFFSYPLSYGDPASVLSTPGGIVLTRALSRKYFGEENSIGKIIRLDNEYDLQVTGIIDNLPGNTHLQFDAVASLALIEKEPWYNEWWNNGTNTYVQVSSADDVSYLQSTFPEFMNKYFGKDFERVGNRIGLKLEPLKEIYFNNDTRYDQNIAHGDKRYVYIFGSIGILLILLAAINYINLATAQTSQRSKEVGIRKTLGSTQRSIALQFLSESLFLCTVSLLVGVAIAQLTIPLFNTNFGVSIPDVFNTSELIYFLPFLLILISLLAGSYPSFLLSSLKPIRIMQGQLKSELHYMMLRKVLIVFQFGISVFMIIATTFISSQLSYMRETDLGFSPNRVAIVHMNNPVIQKQQVAFKEQLLQSRFFESASLSSGHPGGYYDATTVNVEGQEENTRMRTLWTDEDLLATMNISIVEGRYFAKEFPADSASSVVLNETAILQLGWTPEEALGKRVKLAQFDSVYQQIIGVVKDYHFTSLKERIEPLIIRYRPHGRNLLLKFSEADLQDAVASLEKLWGTYQTGFPMEFSFLDDTLGSLYVREQVQGRLFSVFSVISLGIACLGILGLASFMAEQRRKEIGIRKVLGATINQLSVLLVKDLLFLVLIANLIAIPLGYWAILQWSENFAYRVPLNPLMFFSGAIVVMLIAAIIIGANASRTAMENPVKSLRSE
jgi:putative ABC transport system permease protein